MHIVEIIGISAPAVKALMMSFDYRIILFGYFRTRQQFRTECRMLLDQGSLLVGQFSHLLVDDIGNVSLSYIMQVRTSVYVIQQILTPALYQMHVPCTQYIEEHLRILIYQRIHDNDRNLTNHHRMDQSHGVTIQDNLLYVLQ